ncbi:E3 ubiquitin-protein ligase TRIM17-like [Amblyraja radiata]|uniref:E3 ubiquitin-protein ligase TRIM17-like n=1 Tax=Amblyraja radiata TaxID=386614 RepID=UPI001402F041|nr:E3 ubiquitin-protein ligase TRIM17-like [Amblyraja radiata]
MYLLSETLREDLICPICSDLFTNPVSPDCGHNFCRSCITQLWEHEDRNSCPECREEFVDRSLAGREHKSHSFMPVDEAVEIYKEQSQFLQSHITSLFAELHQTLVDKEQRLLKYLSDEKTMILNTMEKNLQEIQMHLNLMQQELPILQKQLDQVNGVTLLQKVAEMASKAQSENWTEETICSICLEFFTNPVSLECGHNFCRHCITRCCETNSVNYCPECRREFPGIPSTINWALASLAEKAQKLKQSQKEKKSKLLCEEHEEELKLFCDTDKKLICLICRDAREHKSHNCIPIKEAVEIYRDQMKSSFISLSKKISEFQEMELQQKQTISKIKSRYLQTRVASEFAEVHKVLTEKEHSLIKGLKEEEVKFVSIMERNLKYIQDKLISIQGKLANLGKQMKQKDGAIFLKEETSRKSSLNEIDQKVSVTGGSLSMGHFNCTYRLQCGENILTLLNLDSAHPELEVSGRLMNLGVAAESVERKRRVDLKPEEGFWTIERYREDVSASNSSQIPLSAGPVPGRVGVYLSYESGTVSFYDADTKSHLHTFTGNKFVGKMYPFFGAWDENQWLKICFIPCSNQ